MFPLLMALLLLAGWGIFAWSARRRWRLMMVGAPAARFDNIGERVRRVWKYGILQARMRRYPLAGVAHALIFAGFIVLLPRTLVLWGRGFVPTFDLWILGTDGVIGKVYSLLKDVFAVLVIGGVLVFFYFRLVQRLARMTLSTEGLIILGIIFTMMAADILYDGAHIALNTRGAASGTPIVTPREFPNEPGKKEVIGATEVRTDDGRTITVPTSTYRELTPEEREKVAARSPRFVLYEPAGSLAAMALGSVSNGGLKVLEHLGFWTHGTLVLLFLNLLPYSKHFHVITGIPNVFLQSLAPVGRLPNITDIDGKLERGETLGIRRMAQFSWKSILDFYTCTECGRCSDHCPATKTGKKLSPKHFTLDLRNFLYRHEQPLVAANQYRDRHGADSEDNHEATRTAGLPEPRSREGEESGNGAAHQIDLVNGVIDPEVLWACTSCRACEQECPVFITYVDKIVDLRRYLVQERGEFPPQLQSAFRGMESSANPWAFPAAERAKWAEGMDIKTIEENPEAPVLFWVGCAPSFDERAKKVTRATAKLMQMAGVDFVILGASEQCTGDPARRAGNEYLFQMFAKTNVEVLNSFGVDKKKIVTTCPHCFNTLRNEYPDFGGRFDVVHHTTFLAGLLQEGKLKPTNRVERNVVYHDSCYLGRYNEVYDAPREALRSIGLTVLEPVQTRDRGMCCGAGGAQMFKEEENGTQRVNALRTEQLLDTKPDAIASACPFCMRMLTDGLADKNRENLPQLDVAEMMLEAMEG